MADYPRFPLFVDLSGKKIVVVGGGRIALRRIRTLTQFTEKVTVVSPELHPDLLPLEEAGRLTVLRRLREAGDGTPILLLTARSETDDKVLGLDSGANDYLTKPFHTQELLARVRAMTRSRTAQPDTRLRLGSVTLDRASFALTAPGGSVRLTNREFQILELLMANPRCVIPTERFLEKIWGFDAEVEANVLWVYISNLRKKLAALGADVQIRTSRNAGFSLEETP